MTTLLNLAITTAVSPAAVGNVFKFNPKRPKSLAIQFNFAGTGGTSVDAYLQTSFDGGTTWTDIAQFHATAAERRLYNLSALTPETTAVTPTDGSMTANTAQDGLIGVQMRVKYASVGTWTAGLLTVDVVGEERLEALAA